MDLQRLEASPVGRLVPISGTDPVRRRDFSHKAFVPHPLPQDVALTAATYKRVSQAERAIGRLDAATARLPNPGLLVRPSLYREAVSTSALEGTHALIRDVLEADFMEDRQKSREVREVENYVRAAFQALELIEQKPICLTVIAELQATLVSGTRGDQSDSGGLRQRQVYIGNPSQGLEQARFVPPPPGELLVAGMSDWEKWINAEDDLPLVVKVALGHYQFETLHPFSDGNGRLGRLISVLQLIEQGALRHPVLNISPWLEAHRDAYKDLMLEVSHTGEFNPWVSFFSEAIEHQASDAVARIERLMAIRDRILADLRRDKARGVVMQIAEALIGFPVITPSRAAEAHGVTFPPANNAILRLVEMGVLQEVTGRSYGRLFVCVEILDAIGGP